MKTISVLAIVIMCSGCAVPLLLGVKDVETAGGTKVSFITGGDFHLGANGVDTVRDSRGIKPAEMMEVRNDGKF